MFLLMAWADFRASFSIGKNVKLRYIYTKENARYMATIDHETKEDEGGLRLATPWTRNIHRRCPVKHN